MRPILILQHHPVETPGVFAEVLSERGLATRTVRPDLGQPVPSDPQAFAGLIVMGGPMGVYEEDRYLWLREEDRLLRAAIARDLPTLGICLGSQLIAKAAGARVAPGPEKEIGWYMLTLTQPGQADPLFARIPQTFESFEWHGDIFDLPRGAVNLASSEGYTHQAFRLGERVYGLLFHLEVTARMVRGMTEAFREEVVGLGYPSRLNAILVDLDRRTSTLNARARRLFETFVTLITLQGKPS
jgi:GMP synthase (glutamine-hydrolysing)